MQVQSTARLSVAELFPWVNDRRTLERLAGHTEIIGQCWIWTGAGSGHDPPYGRVKRCGQAVPVHKLAMELVSNCLIPGRRFDVHHSCRSRLCWRPQHLEIIRRREHRRRTLIPGGPMARAAR